MATVPSDAASDAASSFYGPGVILCWYLTATGVLLTWTLHPQNWKIRSIDADYIAVLAYPTFATIHTFMLRRRLKTDLGVLESMSGAEHVILHSALCSPAFVRAALHYRWKRRVCLAMLPMVLEMTTALNARGTPSWLVLFCLAVLCWILWAMLSYLHSQRDKVPRSPHANRATSTNSGWSQIHNQRKHITSKRPALTIWLMYLGIPFVLLPIYVSYFLVVFRLSGIIETADDLTTAYVDFLGGSLVPQTSASFTDFDQIATALGGAIIFAFRAYDIAKAYFTEPIRLG